MRKYLVKTVRIGIHAESSMQSVIDEYSQDGWIVQEFHCGDDDNALVIILFYKD